MALWTEGHAGFKVFTDSDWAGDLATRKSTSGGVIVLGSHCLKSWSSSQGHQALSSCEAEYHVLVDGATRGIGVQTAARELGIVAEIDHILLATDSSGAKSFASRRGSGRVRHIEVKWLWLQQAVADGRCKLVKVPGSANPADVLTKYKTRAEAEVLLGLIGIRLCEVQISEVSVGAILWGGCGRLMGRRNR